MSVQVIGTTCQANLCIYTSTLIADINEYCYSLVLIMPYAHGTNLHFSKIIYLYFNNLVDFCIGVCQYISDFF